MKNEDRVNVLYNVLECGEEHKPSLLQRESRRIDELFEEYPAVSMAVALTLVFLLVVLTGVIEGA